MLICRPSMAASPTTVPGRWTLSEGARVPFGPVGGGVPVGAVAADDFIQLTRITAWPCSNWMTPESGSDSAASVTGHVSSSKTRTGRARTGGVAGIVVDGLGPVGDEVGSLAAPGTVSCPRPATISPTASTATAAAAPTSGHEREDISREVSVERRRVLTGAVPTVWASTISATVIGSRSSRTWRPSR